MKNKILVICGPTGSGKTKLAFNLAATDQTSIISADSRQVYKGLDIITGKDIPKDFIKKGNYYEKENLRLWGFDLLSPDEVFNAADFSKLTREIIIKEQEENRKVIIVGGTGFYLKSLTKPESLASVIPDSTLRQHLEGLAVVDLQQELWEIDPQKFASMNQSDASNPRRLIRAIEIANHVRHCDPPAGGKAIHTNVEETLNFSWNYLSVSLDQLKPMIEKRIRHRLANGALLEVELLLKNYPNQKLPVYTTLGIKPIVKYLTKRIDFETLVNTWLVDEMNYAKRQVIWFKKQPCILEP